MGLFHTFPSKVSKEFNIKLSTCKAILHVFQKEGRFEKKKKRIRKPKFQQAKANSNSYHTDLYDKSLSWLVFPDLESNNYLLLENLLKLFLLTNSFSHQISEIKDPFWEEANEKQHGRRKYRRNKLRNSY